jgi:hypothetical protein
MSPESFRERLEANQRAAASAAKAIFKFLVAVFILLPIALILFSAVISFLFNAFHA